MSLLASMTSVGMFLAGMALLIVILLRRSYRYYGRRGSAKTRDPGQRALTRERQIERRSLSTAPTDVLRWHVEMQEISRDLKAELDSKMRALQILIRQAREAADRLEQLTTNVSPAASPDFESEDAPRDVPRLPATPERRAAIFALADEGKPPTEIARCIEIPLGEIELILSLRGPQRS